MDQPSSRHTPAEKAQPQIIYAWNYVNWGGAQIYFFGLMKEARKHYRVKALVPENSSQRIFDYLNEWKIDYALLPARHARKPAIGIWPKIMAHVHWVREERDFVRHVTKHIVPARSVIHIDMGFWRSFMPLFHLSLRTGVFVTIHTALPQIAGWRALAWKVKGRILSRMKNFHLLASNEDAKLSLTPYLAPGEAASVEVAYSGFDRDEIDHILTETVDRQAICEKYALPTDRELILGVGQFIERKGCWVLLEALEELRTRSDDFLFLWIGTSAPDAATLERIDDADLAKHFRLISPEDLGKSRSDLLGLLNIADIFVLPSFEEGLPIALVEAMALGKPCIATHINAIPEAIEHGANGMLVDAGNPEALAIAMLSLLNAPDVRTKLGGAAQKTAYEKFNNALGAVTTVRLYGEALASR
jgi:glycosyltransferase involved in cell wall biosynthesis